jgi:molybdenum cofactor biosynthesis enzyme MoaA
VRRYIAEAQDLGVREFYFTGGEPFLHPAILSLIDEALAVAPTTVLTNGTLIHDAMADRLASIATAASYSLEIRISLDAPTAAENDAIRGRGSFAKALHAAQRLAARGLYPLVTATEIVQASGRATLYEQLRALLIASGIDRPRIKIVPVLPIGRCADHGGHRRVTQHDLEHFDTGRLQCTESRVVADGGIYTCPILAGLGGARAATGRLADALGPARLYHTACSTCYDTGIACKNF